MPPGLRPFFVLIPEAPGPGWSLFGWGVALVGSALWLAGARFGRSLLALVAVAVGALVGLKLPELTGIAVSAPVAAIALALGLGIWAYAAQRLWVGAGLSLVLLGWAMTLVYHAAHLSTAWNAPTLSEGADRAQYLRDLYATLPADACRLGGLFGSMALVGGAAVSILWPRLARVSFWSLAGLSIVVADAAVCLNIASPPWRTIVPGSTAAQVAWFAGLALTGAIIQWRGTFTRPQTASRPVPVNKEQTDWQNLGRKNAA